MTKETAPHVENLLSSRQCFLATPVMGEEVRSGGVRITFDANTPPVAYGAGKLTAALTTAAYALDDNGASIVRIEVVRDAELSSAESFRVVRADKGALVIRGGGPSGAMYGALSVADNIRNGTKLSDIGHVAFPSAQ